MCLIFCLSVAAELRTCHPGYFQCSSGHCIAERFKCDGNPDCLDYTDETSCRKYSALIGFLKLVKQIVKIANRFEYSYKI